MKPLPMLRFALRGLWRELRSGEALVLFSALAVAVASMTAVGFFASRVSAGVAREATQVLAADLRIDSANPIPAGELAPARNDRLRRAEEISFPTALFHGDRSQLVAVNAVTPGYPLRGRVRVAAVPYGPAGAIATIPARGTVWLDSRTATALGLRPGASVRLGATRLRFTRVLAFRPDQSVGLVSLAPALLMNAADLPATALVQPGSRVTYAALFAGPPAAVAAVRAYLRAHPDPALRVREAAENSRELGSAIERASRFLNLASLAAVLLAAVGVAMSARRWAGRRIDGVALMKCLGATQRFVLGVALAELGAIGALALLAGTVAGAIAESGIAWLLRSLIERDLPAASARPIAVAAATELAMLLGFALPPLMPLKRTPPLRVLRRDVAPPRLRHGVAPGLALAALFAILWLMVRDTALVVDLAAGIAVVGAALAAAGFALVRLTRRFRGGVGVAWRYGLANVSRRGIASVLQVVAFGLGLMILLLLAVVRGDLMREWRASVGARAPNEFLINIRPQDAPALRRALAALGAPDAPMVPVIRARITAIDARPVASLHFASARGRAFAEREQNLTWSADLMPDNRVIAGRWWGPADYGKPWVSISTEYRDAMHLKLGDSISFDVAGEPLTVRVASIRRVRWDSFRPNFFLVFPPRLLDGAAGTLITSVYLGPRARPGLAELARRFPTITVIDVDAILAQVRTIIDRASLAVQYVSLFTLAAGVIVLLAAVQATRDERRHESAILRTLGASRFTVLSGVAAEFAALGLLSGLLGAAGAAGTGWWVAHHLFALRYAPDPKLWWLGILGGTGLVGVSGTLAARRVVGTPPAQSLRAEA